MSSYNPDEKLIKRPQDDVDLYGWQVDEWLKCAKDKYYFFENYVWVQTPSGRAKFKARPYQKRLIDATEQNRFVVGMASRQSGKSQSFAAHILWQMTFTEDYQILIGSYSNKAVLDFMNRIAYSYQELEWWLKPPAVVFNKFSIRFSNNSSVNGNTFSETFGRGTSTSKIILDELAFADKKMCDEMMGSLIPSISAEGENANTKLDVISTPNGTQGSFYDIWTGALEGDNSFYPVKIDYEEVPGRGPDENGVDRFKEQMMKTPGMTEQKWRQEFLCHFISSGGTLIDSELLESTQPTKPVRHEGDFRLFVDNFAGRQIAIACDPAEGIQGDYSCMQLFDIQSFEQVGEYKNNSVNQTQLMVHLTQIVKLLNNEGVKEIMFTYESNGIGAGIGVLIDTLMQKPDFHEVLLINDPNRENKGKTGMATTNKTKLEACGKFKDLVETGKLQLRSIRLLNELKVFVKNGSSFSAQRGNHDDLVSGCLLFVRMLDEIRNYEENVNDVVSSVSLDDGEELYDIYF